MIKILEKIQMAIGVISLSIFFIAIMIQIVTRHLGIPIIWTEEVANYSFIWSVFMGASVMVNKKEHFSFDFLEQKLQGKSKAGLLIVIDVIVLLFALALFYYGIEAVKNFWNYNWASLPAMKMGYVWISIPIMGLTMSIYSINHLINNFKQLKGREANI
ncbi:MAG: TRAP transporter small permease [Bacillota bacterium]|uniref:TRAP transporter small permease n=1 Tax=Bacillaceae TaxID=186817 RepID=UPI00064F173D|nr:MULTISPECIES: TRAP transporter small permease [Bacillaceae]KML41925.1 C4-dicarboxylate ABC transporter permease [Cytobacillus firmus]MBG9585856.1 C4-dicarboxylate ABC transporter permease [Cytobacillus firmus]MCS0656097.1 TRAP transporter small permease [Cytobacillus firmus]MCU1808428.1 TRAP transporter small permease [Cytobacillus firmus]URT71298.1 TRAP transporter small permease [Cytobacillus firmus]